MSPRLHFVHLDAPDRVEGIARLLLRRNRLRPRVLILCPEKATAQRLDQRLWTIHPESFLAHALHGAPNIDPAAQPILIATSMARDNQPEVLINAGLEVPPELDGFAHIVDFVDGWDPALTRTARERWRTYRSLGLDPQYLGRKR
ncbi:MAG: DNA polymerase III subunit chi [Zetaproteobacteria bacterium]|nr:MAG: DNA polymerase III subunit chi [Zetaproteobacteria bacterium]